MQEQPDAELYRSACKGDRDAFRHLAERHHRYTIRVAVGFVADRSSAEDIAHKAWLNVCRHIKQVQDGERDLLSLKYESSFMGWLKTITSNVARDEYRRRSRLSSEELEDDAVSYEPDLLDRVNVAEMKEAMWEAFKKIGERCRELLLLLIEDPPLSYEQIAIILDRPVGSIGPTRARCIDKLRSNLGQI